MNRIVLLIVVIVLLVGAGYYSFIQYKKLHPVVPDRGAMPFGGPPPMPGMMPMPVEAPPQQ